MSLTFASQTSSFTLRADETVLSIDATDDRIYMLTQLGASELLSHIGYPPLIMQVRR